MMIGVALGLCSTTGKGGTDYVKSLIDLLGTDLDEWWSVRKPSLITRDGNGLVSSWKGMKAGIDAVQATQASQPTYSATALGGQPGVVFNGTSSVLIANITGFPTGATPSEIWGLADQTAPAASDFGERYICGYGANSFNTQRALGRSVSSGPNTNRVTGKVGDGTNNNVVGSSGDFSGVHLARAKIGATSSAVELDSAPAGSKAIVPTTTSPTKAFIGSAVFGTGILFWKGAISDVLFTRALSPEKEAALNDFFI